MNIEDKETFGFSNGVVKGAYLGVTGSYRALRALEPLVETLVEVVELQGGGQLVLTRFEDGSYQLGIETDALSLRCPLSARDMKRTREATGVLLLSEARG